MAEQDICLFRVLKQDGPSQMPIVVNVSGYFMAYADVQHRAYSSVARLRDISRCDSGLHA